MKTVIIELEFDFDDVSDADVTNYLNQLIEDDMLDYEVKAKEDLIEIEKSWSSNNYEILQRKVAHGCTDAFCEDCDNE